MTATLADLQKRNQEQMRQAEESAAQRQDAPAALADPETISAGLRTSVSAEVRKPARDEASTDVRKSASTAVRKAVSTASSEDFLTVVDTSLSSREPLLGGVKATVDMSPELSTRAKRYLADHRGQSTRQVMIALFDAFLKAKGY